MSGKFKGAKMRIADRVKIILERLDEHYGTDYRCSLDHDSAWQLLIATMLSAQCTDARVNIVTKELFAKYPDVNAFADADLKELEQDGLIERHVLPENLRVEYHLTEYGSTLLPILDAVYDWGWHDMKKKDIPIDPLGEMWHGYRKQDASRMHQPFKK